MAIPAYGRKSGRLMLDVAIKAQLGDLALDVAFEAPPGVTALFGPSGSGKTSVINAIAGLTMPEAGRIALDGQVLFEARFRVPPHRRRIGYVFQDARLFPHRTVHQNLTFGGSHDFDRLVDLLGLRDLLDRRPAGLSGGERQRVALGRALMMRPKAVLMDEPLAALDDPRKAEVLPYIASLGAGAGVPVVYVTHALTEVTQLAKQIVILDKGKVARRGALEDVLADPAAARYFAKREGGAMLQCKVMRHENGVTALSSAAGEILLPGHVGRIGGTMRLLIPAQDVILSRTALEGQSALNMLQAQITALSDLPNGNRAVMLQAGEGRLWAELTPLSVQKLGFEVGDHVYAVFKAAAVGPV